MAPNRTPSIPLAVAFAAAAQACAGSGDELAFGSLLVRTLVALVFVSAAAVLSLRWLAARGAPGASTKGRAMEVLERLPLGPRRGLLAVRVADRVLILAEDQDGTRPLAELPASAWPTSFRDLIDDDRVGEAAAGITIVRNTNDEASDPVEQDPAPPSHDIVA